MTAFVLDASSIAGIFFRDEESAETDVLYAEALRCGIVVPAIWPLEVANMLRQGERRGRITPADAEASRFKALAIQVEVDAISPPLALGAVLDLARRHSLTAYDAAYLELALRRSLPLATRDKDIIRAAQAEGASLMLV